MANEQNLKPFKKGHDERRNLEGRPPKLPEIDALMNEVLGKEEDGKSQAQIILEGLVRMACKGSGTVRLRAAEILLDRGYGKPLQRTENKNEHQFLAGESETITPEQIAKVKKALAGESKGDDESTTVPGKRKAQR